MEEYPGPDGIAAARRLLAPHVLRTPLLHTGSDWLRAKLGDGVLLKLELMQRTGTFKFRGALNNVLHLDAAQRRITTVSAGNHAVATACAASVVGADAKLVMQTAANPARRQLAASFGAQLIFRETGAQAFAEAERLVAEEGRVMIHPFDGPLVATATGTLGMEIMEDAQDLDAVVAAVGGGGLIGGLACAVKQVNPNCRVFGVEPEGADGMSQSLAVNQALSDVAVNTIADSLAPPLTTPYVLNLVRRFVDDVVRVSDDEICRALYLLFREANLAVEPAGATALAGALGPLHGSLFGKRVALVVCGSCIDAAGYQKHLARGEQVHGQD